ncbi:hypothetical protein FVB32_05440 [Flagellimonas hymeniacidonis]|uniref:Uncharacterized protein n=1 Tax=Flagellimonas hymeniacidonis TaxID=2603628 RepID=A0A5C8V8R1_9FLAO|nr:hypothetical protein [Flagellimonas hymeniacidonis]TXN37733.1 hypothetical protein FVB32_05440 [Flagellimonas hymeniacidonis]
MGIENLLPPNNSSSQNPKKRGPKTTTPKEKQHTFTVRHGVSTKVLLDRIQKIKELTTPGADNISKGGIIREALELLAKDMDYAKLEKKYAEFVQHISEESIN